MSDRFLESLPRGCLGVIRRASSVSTMVMAVSYHGWIAPNSPDSRNCSAVLALLAAAGLATSGKQGDPVALADMLGNLARAASETRTANMLRGIRKRTPDRSEADASALHHALMDLSRRAREDLSEGAEALAAMVEAVARTSDEAFRMSVTLTACSVEPQLRASATIPW